MKVKCQFVWQWLPFLTLISSFHLSQCETAASLLLHCFTPTEPTTTSTLKSHVPSEWEGGVDKVFNVQNLS
jgi:hypothetical protein